MNSGIQGKSHDSHQGPYEADGCEAIINAADRDIHRDSCDFRPVPCPFQVLGLASGPKTHLGLLLNFEIIILLRSLVGPMQCPSFKQNCVSPAPCGRLQNGALLQRQDVT